MMAWVAFASARSGCYEEECDIIEKIFSSREAAEKFVMGDPVSDMFCKIEVADCPGVTWYYFMETPVYRIEEHCIVD